MKTQEKKWCYVKPGDLVVFRTNVCVFSAMHVDDPDFTSVTFQRDVFAVLLGATRNWEVFMIKDDIYLAKRPLYEVVLPGT